MSYVAALVGITFVLVTLLDAFEVVLLPRPVRHRVRLNRYFFMSTWSVWSRCARRVPVGTRREDFIGVYGPLSMVLLFTLWAGCLVFGFGLIQWALQAATQDVGQPLVREIIVSGDAFFTLGYGDIVPRSAFARLLVILESGTGFGFIALAVGYLPVLYQHFARRDVQLIELAARAGSPATASALLRWHAARNDPARLDQWLRDWERWACDLIESHSTYPMLAFYRSQHDGHSWLASLAVVLDVCTSVLSSESGGELLQAEATFEAARRALDEVSDSLGVPLAAWDGAARSSGLERREADSGDVALMTSRLRKTYEPQLCSLSGYLLLPLPAWVDQRGLETAMSTREEIIERLVSRIR